MSIWSSFPLSSCLPDNCGCEFIQFDQLIAQPSAFWSSLFYIFFAILIYGKSKDKSQRLKLWTFSLMILGLSSHFAHASFLEFAMAMDFAGIVLVASFFTLYKSAIKRVSSTHKLVFLLLSFQGGLCIAFYSLEKWVQFFLCLIFIVVCIVELLHSEGKAFLKERDLQVALVVLFISFCLFMIDDLRLICDPHSWLTFHSLWHFGTALSLYFYGKWRLRYT